MNARIPVVAELPEYVVAVAGLPLSMERVDRAAGAIVVVDGATQWWDATALAVEAGAAAVLVGEPREVPLERVARLAELAEQSGVPILVHRARLRDDRSGRAIDALRAERKAGDGGGVLGQFGDDGDPGVHDGAPGRIAAAAASARSIAKIASSRTSWYSMVAVPSRSAASARHSRTYPSSSSRR